jgi:hypothetical protein
MERLKALVLQQANAERVGGRVTVVDGRTLILYDCMHWGCHSTDVVVAQHPEVQISVRACRQSLSGFSVIFHRGGSGRRELAWYLAIGFVLAGCCYALLRPPWWPRGTLHI